MKAMETSNGKACKDHHAGGRREEVGGCGRSCVRLCEIVCAHLVAIKGGLGELRHLLEHIRLARPLGEDTVKLELGKLGQAR